MNGSLPYLIMAALALFAVGALVWALRERGRALRAETRLSMLEGAGDAIRAQAAQSANLVADELLKRADETFRNRELLAQQRLETQLKPISDLLAPIFFVSVGASLDLGSLNPLDPASRGMVLFALLLTGARQWPPET